MRQIIETLKAYGVFKRLIVAVALLLGVFVLGCVGYMFLEGYNLLDAVYMTIITVASVGFNEVQPLDASGKIFTSFLIIASVTTYAYAITIITTVIIEDEFRNHFKHIRVNKEIKQLKDHVIVCGYGRNGKQACQQLASGKVSFVVVESNPAVLDQLKEQGNILFIEGNATEDNVLENAGIREAKGLIAALPDDAANVFIVLTAREQNPKLKIISRASSDTAEGKLKRAGANNVIMPDRIGGTHMAALITKPDVLEFLDFITGKIHIKMEEVHYDQIPPELRGKGIGQLHLIEETGVSLVGYKRSNGEYIVNPPMDTVMQPMDKMFVLGSADQIEQVAKRLHRG
jgi:voltage-gated potassium channel